MTHTNIYIYFLNIFLIIFFSQRASFVLGLQKTQVTSAVVWNIISMHFDAKNLVALLECFVFAYIEIFISEVVLFF